MKNLHFSAITKKKKPKKTILHKKNFLLLKQIIINVFFLEYIILICIPLFNK